MSQKMGGKKKKKSRVEQEKRGQGIVWRSDLAAKGLKSLNLICEENVSWVSTAGMSRDKTHWTNLQRGMYKTLSLLHCWPHVSMINHTPNLPYRQTHGQRQSR